MMKAAEEGEIDVCELLLAHGASPGVKDDEGWNALMWASLTGQLDVVQWLITECHQLAEYSTEKGETPLMKAATNGHWDTCKFLIEQGAKVNYTRFECSCPSGQRP
jgi:ankyrin repeat protein